MIEPYEWVFIDDKPMALYTEDVVMELQATIKMQGELLKRLTQENLDLWTQLHD